MRIWLTTRALGRNIKGKNKECNMVMVTAEENKYSASGVIKRGRDFKDEICQPKISTAFRRLRQNLPP